MTPALMAYGSLLGRILISAIFLMSGVGKIQNWDETMAYMEAQGLPAGSILLPLAILVEIGCGLALLLGWQTRWAALVLFLFLIPTTFVFHHFWDLEGAAQSAQMVHFLKNLAIMGGLLEFSAMGAGVISIDGLASRSNAIGAFSPKNQAPA